jgi:predicted double-glycine peptidase
MSRYRHRKVLPAVYATGYDEGHYVVAVGYDSQNFYFMDPATLGNYTYIPTAEFASRWHDSDQVGKKLEHFGIVYAGTPDYNQDAVPKMK